MTDNPRPMTVEDRAFYIKCVAGSQIQQAVDQARKEGFEQAREMAAKLVADPIEPEGHYGLCYDCDCHSECPQTYYPPLIRSLQPPQEGAE